jgi:hypothetical protein
VSVRVGHLERGRGSQSTGRDVLRAPAAEPTPDGLEVCLEQRSSLDDDGRRTGPRGRAVVKRALSPVNVQGPTDGQIRAVADGSPRPSRRSRDARPTALKEIP